jgi:hypothetical protein
MTCSREDDGEIGTEGAGVSTAEGTGASTCTSWEAGRDGASNLVECSPVLLWRRFETGDIAKPNATAATTARTT